MRFISFIDAALVTARLIHGANAAISASLDEAPGTHDNYEGDCNLAEESWLGLYPPFEGTGQGYQIGNESAAPLSGPADLDLRRRQSSPKDFYLRILPLGASIVEGYESFDGTGFRKLLRNQLRWKGWLVNYVGSKQNGNMADKVSKFLTYEMLANKLRVGQRRSSGVPNRANPSQI